MRKLRYLPANLAGLALIVVLSQAQANAETKETDDKNRVRSYKQRKKRLGRRVVKRQHGTRVARSSMRQRAFLYEPYIAAAARKHGVDPRVLWTIAYLETRFRPDQVSPVGARGMMQFMPGTARRFRLANPHDAVQSIDAAARYVAELTRQFNGRLDLVLAAYNSGETAVDCYLKGRTVRKADGRFINPRGIRTSGVPPYKETQSYVRRGVLVFNKVTSVSVFSPELVAATRMLHAPATQVAVSEQMSVERELAALGGGMPAVLYSTKRTLPAPAAPRVSNPAAFDMVFYDVVSGARYLVASGEIVKSLESVSEEGAEAPVQAQTKSVYLGSREE